MRHIGIGRTHARTHAIVLIQDHDLHVINATTGEVLRELPIDPTRDYQPQKQRKLPNPCGSESFLRLERSHCRADSVLFHDIGNPSLKT